MGVESGGSSRSAKKAIVPKENATLKLIIYSDFNMCSFLFVRTEQYYVHDIDKVF